MSETKSMKKPRKGDLHQTKHPFDDAYPFEAFLNGSWQPVEHIKIESGRITLQFKDNQHMVIKISDSVIRIRSRKATLSDCSCFLRPGMDICVLSAPQSSDNSNEVWVDARVNSVKRIFHDPECSCEYYVNLYVNQGSFSTEKRILNKEVKVVGLSQISILQKLERDPCEGNPHRWALSEDCSAVPQTKLLVLGKFLSDLTWFLVTSTLKKVSFFARSANNKIVYQVLLGSDDTSSSNSLSTDTHINVVNFIHKVKDDTWKPVFAQVDISMTKRIEQHPHDSPEDEVTPFEGIRRSKRRNIKPKRYYSSDDANELDVGTFRTRPYKIGKWENAEEPVPLAIMPNLQEKLEEDAAGTSERVDKVNSCREIIVYTRRKNIKDVKSAEKNNNDKGKEVLDFSTRFHSNYSIPMLEKNKNSSGVNDMDFEPRWEGLNSSRRHAEKRYRSSSSRNRNEERAHRDRSSNAAYEEMINSYLRNRNKIAIEEDETIMDQWNKGANIGQKNETETSLKEDEEEDEEDEMEMLWRELDEGLAISRLEETKDSNAAAFAETEEKSGVVCPHDYRLDEQIGICCNICGDVKTEIKYIFSPFLEKYSVCHRKEKQSIGESSEAKVDEEYDDFHIFSTDLAPGDEPVSEENENVWSLIPELRERMHDHQKKAFEFLWRNIAGSMEPALMESESNRRGGCVISHSPGAGKTFLLISFLVSYLKIFPGNRPLVLAPKTTLYTWYKEFIKWGVSIPVYLIHARRGKKEFDQTSVTIPGFPKPSGDVKHALDCLEKIKKWRENPSVLVMGYNSFLSLTREDSKFSHKRYMAKKLRESPGILIMDEGHNPRSTKSRLRKGLMKVNTDLRILLSGTLFQNNFCEYFNTLCLARPKFVDEVLKELDPKYNTAEKERHIVESRARKLFFNNIADKIESSDGEERMLGLNMLRNMTNGFVDVYDSGNSISGTLPGLQIYTLLMNTTDLQGEILKILHQKIDERGGYPLEIEFLITLGSIHPWLITTSKCVQKFFTGTNYLEKLENYKSDPKVGTKVKFVLSLVHRVVKIKEKVLIFCHYMAPVKLLVELFESFFHWKKGKEILLLNGEQELFERGKVIDKFEEPGGVAKVLLASITACAEGISLTSASRVIMLDSQWNPSKTKQAIARAFRPGQQKMVYVYQLLTAGSLEEDKYRRTTWKEWVSSSIFSEDFVEDPSQWQAQKIEDDILREMVEDDKSKSFHMIMKNEKASTN